MTPPPQRPGGDRTRRPRRAMRWAPLWLVLAVAISLLVHLPFAHWVLEWRMVEFLVPWLLRPSTGFLSLALALWLLFTVPGTLRVLAGGGQAPAQETTDSADAGVRGPSASTPGQAAAGRLDIPAGTFREMGAGHRFEMAEALGIPWRDELIHDHQSWAHSCLEAAQRKAAERTL